MKKLFFLIFVLGFLTSFLPATGEAAGLVPCGGEGEPACVFCHLLKLIKNILDVFLFPIVPVVASLLIAIGGFFLFTAAGNPQNLGRARTIFFATIIGLLIIYGSWLFINLLLASLGVVSFGGPGTWWEIECPLPLACDNPDAEFTVFATKGISLTDPLYPLYNGSTAGGTSHDGRGADAICQQRAAAAGLSGSFTAWFSDGASEPRDRGLKTCAAAGSNSASWRLPGGGPTVAEDWNDLVSGDIDAPINRDERGDAILYPLVYTGTDASGNSQYAGPPPENDMQCQSWTWLTDTCVTLVTNCLCLGYPGSSDARWTDNNGFSPGCQYSCNNTGGIYCFQYAE